MIQCIDEKNVFSLCGRANQLKTRQIYTLTLAPRFIIYYFFYRRDVCVIMAAAAALRAVRLEGVKDGIALIKMIKGDNRMNMPFLNSMGKALDEVER